MFARSAVLSIDVLTDFMYELRDEKDLDRSRYEMLNKVIGETLDYIKENEPIVFI